ncbi:MAG: hypothetical protein HQM00_05570 [Magnetococcales bacterium]|nr:hypothetical protein [Magnetococcales bacterium]
MKSKFDAKDDGRIKMDSDMVSQTVVAAMLGVHPRTLHNWRNKGIGPPWQKVDGSTAIVYSKSGAERYRETREQEKEQK